MLLGRPRGRRRQFARLGTPGTGKSWLHGYILWKLLKGKRDNRAESWSEFELVLRQVGDHVLYVYQIGPDASTLKVWFVRSDRSMIGQVLALFEGNAAVLFLYDPKIGRASGRARVCQYV